MTQLLGHVAGLRGWDPRLAAADRRGSWKGSGSQNGISGLLSQEKRLGHFPTLKE
jgi:hypothetical protein